MKRYNGLVSLVVGVLVLVLSFGSSYLGAKEKPTIQVAYNSLPFNLPSLVERELGFLTQQGFEVQYHNFLVGHAMTEAMASGNLDVAPVMGATSTIVSKAGGRDIKVIGCYSQAPSAFGLAVRPGSITLDQLRGAKIAVPVGTEVHVLLGKILAEQGLTLKDVHLVNLLVPDGITALQSGQVDAAMVVEPVMSRLEQAGKIEVLRDGVGLISGLTLSVVPSSLVGSAQVTAFQEAHTQSLAYLREHPEEVMALAISQLDLPPLVVENVARKYTFNPDITDQIRAELEDTIEFLYQERIIRKRISVDDLF